MSKTTELLKLADERDSLYQELGRWIHAAIISNYKQGELTNKEWLFDYMLRNTAELTEKIDQKWNKIDEIAKKELTNPL